MQHPNDMGINQGKLKDSTIGVFLIRFRTAILK